MAAQDYEQYQGRILRVDLSRREIKAERVSQETLRQCLGGACLGAKLLYDEVPPGVGWSDPENRLIIASGPLGATAVPGSGTITVATKGALTEGSALTQANGFFGAYLRLCGYDAVVVQGAADKLTYVYIHDDGEAELRDATPLAGKDTWETGDLLSKELGLWPLAWVSIGPAGENLVRFAGIFSDKGHAAAHNGVGAVMGSKKLKAIVAAEGRRGVPVQDGPRLLKLAEELSRSIKETGESGMGIYRWGTLMGVTRSVEGNTGTLPVKNYSTSVFDIDKEKLERFGGPYVRSHFTAVRAPCWGCLMHHSHVLKVPEGPYKGRLVDEPEYEGFAAWGPVTGQTDVTWTVVLADLVDRLGMDTNEAGWVISWVMECYEKGFLTLEDTDGLEM
ncbi:MAG: aldehyde ferredoxin oxidoreductase N-terminal domain-containing protein, partial [Chloroflexota bacterium]|nr:aldehyde ferredoxin oxidoreductase N-terminal domain-containing protein [Chloroflexota bacterium]